MKLILTRHGESIGNVEKIHEGSKIGGQLSKLGKEQAKKLGTRLKNEKIDCIYSSDLGRAKETLKEIIKFHKNIKVKFLKELREIDVGDFSGKKFHETDWNTPPKNLESYENAQKRAKKAVDIAYKEFPMGTVLFLAHGYLNKTLIALILKIDTKYIEQICQENTCINIFEIKEDGNHTIRLLNCTKHL